MGPCNLVRTLAFYKFNNNSLCIIQNHNLSFIFDVQMLCYSYMTSKTIIIAMSVLVKTHLFKKSLNALALYVTSP